MYITEQLLREAAGADETHKFPTSEHGDLLPSWTMLAGRTAADYCRFIIFTGDLLSHRNFLQIFLNARRIVNLGPIATNDCTPGETSLLD